MNDENRKRWFPLESNPDVMNAYVASMGFSTSEFRFCDVLSTEEWWFRRLWWHEVADKKEAARIDKEGQIVSSNVYYMRQTVGNACGTVNILHAIGNMRHLVRFHPGSFLNKFFIKIESKTPEEIGRLLAEDDELEHLHGSAAETGQSEELESLNDEIITHFVCFSCVNGNLYELDIDERKSRPINHGVSSPDTILQDACKVIKQYMARDADEMRFTILALAE